MVKLYRVVAVDGMEEYGVSIGDVCSLVKGFSTTSAWFYSESWLYDGTWVLDWVQLEEFTETN